MFNVELYNKTAKKVIASAQARTEAEASKIARGFISRVKAAGTITNESNFDISPRGYVIGQTIHTANAVYDITTGRM